jgi:hypothetical protein
MPGMPFCGPGTLVRQAEELGDVLHVMCGQLLQHLLVSHTLSKCNNDKSIGDARDGVVNLGEPLDEGAQSFPRALLHGVEVGLIAEPRVDTLKVGHELMTQLFPGE